MISLWRPSASKITAFCARQAEAPFGYPEVGATDGTLPEGYYIDETEETIGHGEADFEAARAALRVYRHYGSRGGRIRLVGDPPPCHEGSVVVLLGCHLGLWTLSACRVVYTFDQPRSFGYAYGTLEHAVRGEERFELALRPDGDVVFRLLAFSRPASLLVRLGTPLARRFQRAAGRAYAEGLREAIRAS